MIKLNVPDMTCGHCEAAIRKAVKSVDPSADVMVDLPARTVDVRGEAGPDDLRAAIAAEGYVTEAA